jgi:hypothetical protein
MMLRQRLDVLGVLVLFAGTISMFAQLSLNAPLYEHSWLWAGAVIAVLERHWSRTETSIKSMPATVYESRQHTQSEPRFANLCR